MLKTLRLESISDAPSNSLLDDLVDACHILAANGHASGLAGQITLRAEAEQGGAMWTLAMGTGLDEAKRAHLILVDQQLRTLHGNGRANPAVEFHRWIYERYAHVNAVVHTHAPALSALSMLGCPMPVAHMDAAIFYEDCGHLAQWPGVPTGAEEGRLISEALDGKKTVLLANHGAVCAGASLQEAIYLKVFAERNARMCLDALAAGELKPIEPAPAREAHDFLLQASIVNATFAYWARSARRHAPQ
jgi:L-fuculose-phosphate aldolase